VTSGIRIGTSAVTTRGMREAEMKQIASLIDRVLKSPDDQRVMAEVRDQVRTLARAFPLYV
jgi:glycine hydroxymethyltransferase